VAAKKKEKSADDFWREYEESTGEKVLARTIGQYLSGWDEFDAVSDTPLWGLAIVTSGGFRFHHFPQHNWLDTIFRPESVSSKEKTLFVPKDRITNAILTKESGWLKKLLGPVRSMITVRYTGDDSSEKELKVQTEFKTDGFAENLQLISGKF